MCVYVVINDDNRSPPTKQSCQKASNGKFSLPAPPALPINFHYIHPELGIDKNIHSRTHTRMREMNYGSKWSGVSLICEGGRII